MAMRKDIHRSSFWSYPSAPVAHMIGGVAMMFLLGTLWPVLGDHGSGWAPWALSASSRWTWRWISLALLALAALVERIAADIAD
jgi:hypothetical protein